MNEAVTKRFLLYFRLMLLVWILIVNSILHVVGFAYSWLIFLSNIMLFTMEGDIKDRFVSVELGGLVGMVFTVIALLAITFLTPVLGSFFGFLIPLAVVLFVLIILHPYAPKVLNNVGFAYLTVACIDAETFAANLPLFRANLCPLTFVDVPPEAYARAMLGVYEMGRVELLRDLLVWAYERSTAEYVAIRQTLAEPDPLRLAWRQLIKDTVHAVVTQPGADAVGLVEQAVAAQVPEPERAAVRALILDELRRLHDGVLARYRLRPAQWRDWVAAQSARY